ncbi:MAG TPA: hypothetical protein VK116_19960, partial [Planctomycetota bacterium]|nr:hypothetical protein [Planctomycetota bacterium]
LFFLPCVLCVLCGALFFLPCVLCVLCGALFFSAVNPWRRRRRSQAHSRREGRHDGLRDRIDRGAHRIRASRARRRGAGAARVLTAAV